MANNIVPLDQLGHAHLPQKMRERLAQGIALNQNFIDGIRDAYPTLSIKGKVFRFRHQGVEQMALDENRRPVSYIDVVMVDASPSIAKTYYAKGYTEGDMDPPDCWSLDGIKPDASVEVKVNPTCLNCPMNQFGSRVTDAGKQAKACQDQRRIALTMDHQLEADRPLVVMSRIPQGSLKNLKIYADMLARYGVEINGVITRLSFDPAEAFPKLQFEYAGVLNDVQYDVVLDLAEGEEVRVMLNAPITDTAEDNLDASQVARAPAKRPVQPGAATPAQAQPKAAPVVPPQEPQEPEQRQDLASPAAKAAEASRAAREEVHEQTGAPVPPEPVAGIMKLPDGRFYNPVTQAFCGPDGLAEQPAGVVSNGGMTAAQAESVQTWKPPANVVIKPMEQQPPAAANADAPAPAPTAAKRTRRAPAAAPDPAAVAAATPGLENVLASLLRNKQTPH